MINKLYYLVHTSHKQNNTLFYVYLNIVIALLTINRIRDKYSCKRHTNT